MTTPEDVDRAEARVMEARARLHGTVDRLQAQLAPGKVAQDVRHGLLQGARATAAAGARAARRKPALAIGSIALLAAVAGRHRIAAAVRSIFRRTPKP